MESDWIRTFHRSTFNAVLRTGELVHADYDAEGGDREDSEAAENRRNVQRVLQTFRLGGYGFKSKHGKEDETQ